MEKDIKKLNGILSKQVINFEENLKDSLEKQQVLIKMNELIFWLCMYQEMYLMEEI